MLRNCSVLISLLLMLAPVASADVIVDLIHPTDGDSGWSVVLADNVNSGVVVDRVTASYVRIEIAKTFTQPPQGGAFASNIIGFRQRLADDLTAPTIQITDEVIHNQTGADWTDYHWEIVGSAAAFDKAATDASSFSISPFTLATWGAAQTGWDSGHPATLDVDGGVVPHGGTFTPGLASGKLYIDVDLTVGNSDFDLKQTPTPEPGAMLLIGLGGAVTILRRRRR